VIDSGWVTAGATVVLAAVTAVYVVRLEAAYARSIRPHLQWQDPQRSLDTTDTATATFSVVVRSSGPGLARVTSSRVRASTGTDLAIRDFRVPCSLPVDAQYTFYVVVPDFAVEIVHKLSTICFEFDYTDIENERCYSTFAVIEAMPRVNPSATTKSPVEFADIDERPPDKRRTRCAADSGRRWPWRPWRKR
jgi:hypothetical protein